MILVLGGESNQQSACLQMEVIVGDFGMVVVPRDGADTERIMKQSSVLRKHQVGSIPLLFALWGTCADVPG